MTLNGFLHKIRYRDQKTGYTVFVLRTNKPEDIICCGTLPDIPLCTPLSLEGDYGRNPKYPSSFCVFEILSFCGDKASEISYLVGVTDGEIDHEAALKITDSLGCSIFEAVLNVDSPEEFQKQIALPLKQAYKIYDATLQTLKFKDLLDIMSKCGGSYSETAKLFDLYEDSSIELLKKNPYKICHMLGFPFSIADHLGEHFGFGAYSKERSMGILEYAISSVLSQGSTFALIWEIRSSIRYIQKAARLEKLHPYYVLSYLPELKDYYFDKEERVYRKDIKEYEDILVRNIQRIYKSRRPVYYDEELVNDIIKNAGTTLAKEQKNVFNAMKREGISLIVGGPGVGKTFCVNLLIEYMRRYSSEEDICLIAPTGCAAQKMSEKANGMKSQTIHSLLGLRPFARKNDDIALYDSNNQLPYKYYIIDEFSMADLKICSLLFSAIPNHATVIIVGDPDQLPSVGTGNVLADFIKSSIFETFRLTEIFRQAEDSRIIDNARLVRDGITDLAEGSDFHIFKYRSSKETTEACLSHVKATDGDDLQILCPIKKYEEGTRNINNVLQSMTDHSGQYGKVYGAHTYYVGDHVITIRNNKEDNYFNGEPAVITLIDDGGVLIRFVNGDETYIKNADLGDITPSKALTAHKSQGNEYDRVVFLLTDKSKAMLSRQIFYTAITRAKKSFDLFLQEGCLDMIRIDRRRSSLLSERLMDIIFA